MNKTFIAIVLTGLAVSSCKTKKNTQESAEEVKEGIDSTVVDMFDDLDESIEENENLVIERPRYQEAERRDTQAKLSGGSAGSHR